ncbi:MAG: CPBP family intramembrane metalloprotease [Eubacteriaceae bacterium]|uniref:CPBP family intramembrane metalloprotease n=1 Tax=Candidatus Pseudoramibacter fermentans TaxID=2594427 RepID=A0A6L5GT02_9FIRM|nr:CPBP family intramembrane metalloprotease [Candidatus Pseudoramibacter fermentans]RRF93283.1 MAG: CPBP family intramembrane metalloprotease [Eubacteriaceae bacterium]
MNDLKRFLQGFWRERPLSGAVLYFFAVSALFFGVGRLLPQSIGTEIIFRLILSALILIFLYAIYGWTPRVLGFSAKGIGTSIRLSWSEWLKIVIYLLLLLLLSSPQGMQQFKGINGVSKMAPVFRGVAKNLAALTPQKLILTVLFGVSVGLFEETFFRVGLVAQLRVRFADSCRGAWCTVLIGAGLFAALHMMNAFGQSLAVTAMQVIQAFGTGVLWGAVYWRSGNAVIPVIIHSLTDILILLATAGTAASAAPGFGSSVALMAFDVGLAAIYLRPQKTRYSGIQTRSLWYNDQIGNGANLLK